MFYEISFLLSAALSTVSTGILVIYFLVSPSSRTYSFQLVFPVFFYDLIIGLNYLIPIIYYYSSSDPQISSVMCKIEGFIKLFMTNSTFFTALTISYTLYIFLTKKHHKRINNPIMYYAPFTFILPMILALVPLFFDRYQQIPPLEQVMCFMVIHFKQSEPDVLGIVLKIFLSLTPFVITLFLDIYFIGCILKAYIRRDTENIPTEVRNLVLYPIIFLFSWIWIMTERFYEMVTDGDQVGWLNDIDLQGSIISGFLNTLIYGYLSINPFKSCCEDKSINEEENMNTSHINQDYQLNYEGNGKKQVIIDADNTNMQTLINKNEQQQQSSIQSSSLSSINHPMNRLQNKS